MRVPFTKMQGAGNDFVVLDETRQPLGLGAAQYRFLADRHFGVGADQILTVRPSPAPGIDFEYVIHNADGGQVEQCGNGARCFARFVRDRRLTDKDTIRVQTLGGVIEPRIMADGRVRVDMGAPAFDPAAVAVDTQGLTPLALGGAQQWPLALTADGAPLWLVLVSMGNPHAVQWVSDVDTAPVAQTGPLIEGHPRFARRVNAGYGQIADRRTLRLRVFERGVGETLACGTGACAAAVAGMRAGLLDT
ncbi:MAG: diaminopimelate epimerase, partial [Proteobacteria bacterium]|nr:diaminopimelate epimerase [Pseudomonadota bacterium]